MDKYKTWPEINSSSPSVGHLGHIQALFRPFSDKRHDTYDIHQWQEAIASVHRAMLGMAYTNKHVVNRWHNVVSVMIEKDPGTPLIH